MPASLLNLTELYPQMYMHTTTVRKRFLLFQHASNVSEYKIMKQIGKSLFGCIFLQHFLLVYDTVAVTTLLIITDLCGIFVTVQR